MDMNGINNLLNNSKSEGIKQDFQEGSDVLRLDVAKYLKGHGIPYFLREHEAGKMYGLLGCILNEAHTDWENVTAIIQTQDGSLLYQCSYCQDKTWEDVRQVISGSAPLEQWVTGGAEEWPDPIPLDDFESLPSFPIERFPQWYRHMAEDIIEVNQVDPGLPGSIILGALSTCLAKKAIVDLGTHREPLNLYLASVSGSGERKTPTVKRLTAPIYSYQADRQKELAPIVADYETDMRILESKRQTLEKMAGNPREVT
jgi:hypothetical protein